VDDAPDGAVVEHILEPVAVILIGMAEDEYVDALVAEERAEVRADLALAAVGMRCRS
jgi:hypothetical protein